MTRISVLAAVVKRGNRYLVCQRPFNKRHGGLWEFPGGKLEKGETLLQAAQRELREELGVAVVEIHEPLLSIADPGSEFVIVFTPVAIEGEPRCLEHVAVLWATSTELYAMRLAPSDRAFVDGVLSVAIDAENVNE